MAAIESYIRFQSQNYHVGSISDHTFKILLQTKKSFVVSTVTKKNTFRFNFKDVDNRYQKKKPAPKKKKKNFKSFSVHQHQILDLISWLKIYNGGLISH